jgi:hypothetical protein
MACASESWCAFTTFGSLETYSNYWCKGFPDQNDLLDDCVADGGVWDQQFQYGDLAHLIVPRKFRWEKVENGKFFEGYKYQDIELLSSNLSKANLPHRKTQIVLEVKFF